MEPCGCAWRVSVSSRASLCRNRSHGGLTSPTAGVLQAASSPQSDAAERYFVVQLLSQPPIRDVSGNQGLPSPNQGSPCFYGQADQGTPGTTNSGSL